MGFVSAKEAAIKRARRRPARLCRQHRRRPRRPRFRFAGAQRVRGQHTSTGATLYCINYSDAQGQIDVVNVSNTGASALTTQLRPMHRACPLQRRELRRLRGRARRDRQRDHHLEQNGYELYGLTPPYSHIKTIAANVSENFGYDVATDQVWSPQYSGSRSGGGCSSPSLGCTLDLIDIPSGSLYSLVAPTPVSSSTALPVAIVAPDAGAVDPTTGIAVAPEEYSKYSYIPGTGTYGQAFSLYLLSIPNVQLNVPSPGPSGSGTFPGQKYYSDAAFAQVQIPNNVTSASWQISDVAIDAPDHFVFFAAEFSSPGTIGVAQLPTAATTTPQLGDYTFANLPAEPSGKLVLRSRRSSSRGCNCDDWIQSVCVGVRFEFVIPRHHRPQGVFTAPRSTSDPHLVAPTYNLLTNHVITYIAIPGGSGGGG